MRLRGPAMTIGALGIAALAAGVSAVWTGIDHAQAIRAMAVSATITIDPGIKETFAPPPASAQPAMTAELAWAQWEQHAGATITTIAPNTTAHLGLLTLPVRPYCGAECDGLIVKNGIAYQTLNQLAWGYSWPAFPHLHPGQMNWIFLGRVIATSTTGRRFAVAVKYRGRFQLRLPPGAYQLTGYSPRVRVNHAEMRCVASHPVRLRAGQSKRRNVYCSVP